MASEGESGANHDRIDVSVVIPCRNGAPLIARQLEALSTQGTSARVEIVVADNGSTDDTVAIVNRFSGANARVVDASRAAGINVARNVGAAATTGSLILFCDHDDLVQPNWIEAYWTAFTQGMQLGGGRQMRTVGGDTTAAVSTGLNNSLRFLPWPTGANCAVAASVLENVGPFNESYRGGGDETEFFWRAQLAGHRLWYVEDAVIEYVQRESLADLARQQTAYGRSQVRLYEDFRSLGMPPSTSAMTFLRALYFSAMLMLSLITRNTSDRRRAVSALALFGGRLSRSLSSRKWYV